MTRPFAHSPATGCTSGARPERLGPFRGERYCNAMGSGRGTTASSSLSARAGGRSGATADRPAFTIVEVMMAASMLVLVIASSLTVLQTGMRAVDTARNMTLAGQICQSTLEVLRLQNWTQVSEMPAVSEVDIDEAIGAGTATALDATLNAAAARFMCTRTVTSPKPDMRRIAIVVHWRGNDGRVHLVSAEARYAKNGLHDYIYVSH